MCQQEKEEMENRFNSYTYTDGKGHSSTAPTGGARPMTSETGTSRYHRKRFGEVSQKNLPNGRTRMVS